MKSVFRAVLPLCVTLAALGGAAPARQAFAQAGPGSEQPQAGMQAGASAAPQAASLSSADRAWLQKIEQALNRSPTFQARIQQIDANGKRTTGTVWMKRPGQMRLAYDAPSPLLLVATDGKVVFRDNQLDQTTVIPMERTPLGLLLRQHVSLSDDVTVTDFQHAQGFVQVTLTRTSSPGDGTLTLVFYEKPVALRSWSVVDAQGRQTQVTLFDVHEGGDLPASLFVPPADPQ
ncbi:outer-membrane lipoprotein carrier protein LolA [Acetobacter sp. TBRC 12305]|uniref:Outer membrane lipoprotein carrier protein LolA n=1 Tax=Acetobacter garciniae TaxID=2817435 RepID=A0A939KRR0_9PROT|nr:outer membrane lipoprotein carrier protein LolA [Acetobacter garciniae]MBO1325931.1 outer membrane lipoprotein carrier protein LolA [Acetobacter garciniae]MBX0345831.1 outer-membrane lipoprotein carrier protein LolA [Acetobacter garciniae]